MSADRISEIETAIVARLAAGLGKMVRTVAGYAGELDDELPNTIRAFPAAWVAFAGISKTEPYGTSRTQWKTTGQFQVMVGSRNLRGGSAARQGVDGPGTHRLVEAVRQLLTQQDLGLAIARLRPGRVRTLYNSRIEGAAFQAFACEFETAWIETALPNGDFPSPTDPLFMTFEGATTPDDPDLLSVDLNYHLSPDDGVADASDSLSLRS